MLLYEAPFAVHLMATAVPVVKLEGVMEKDAMPGVPDELLPVAAVFPVEGTAAEPAPPPQAAKVNATSPATIPINVFTKAPFP